MKKLLCRQNWKPRLPTAHKVDDFQAVGLAEHGLGKMLAGQNFSIAFNHHPCCVMPARGQQIGHAARCSKGFGFPVDCDIHTRLQKKTATGVFSQFEGVMACGDAERQKNTRKTITAAGEHNPAKKQVGPASLRRYYPRQVQNRVFLCDSRGQGAITLSQPFMAPPAGSRTLGLAHEECKQNRAGFCPLRAKGNTGAGMAIIKCLHQFTKRVKIFTSLRESAHAGRVSSVTEQSTVQLSSIGYAFNKNMQNFCRFLLCITFCSVLSVTICMDRRIYSE